MKANTGAKKRNCNINAPAILLQNYQKAITAHVKLCSFVPIERIFKNRS
jgi:hypothetical protein